MKKLSKLKLKEFREMSDSEMKNVLGGFYDPLEGGGTGNVDGGSGAVSCTVSLTCAQSSISCSSTKGECSNIWDGDTLVAIECEGETYKCK